MYVLHKYNITREVVQIMFVRRGGGGEGGRLSHQAFSTNFGYEAILLHNI